MLQQDSRKPDSEFLADSAITAFSVKASERNQKSSHSSPNSKVTRITKTFRIFVALLPKLNYDDIPQPEISFGLLEKIIS